ncbi:MAG: TonB-dependent receptor, partial [Rickettsiales bacterium]
VHTPSRFDTDGRLSYIIIPPHVGVPLPTLVSSAGDNNLNSEELIAYEIGYRIQPITKLAIDVTAYYNNYSRLLTDELGTPTILGTYIYQPVITGNDNKARSLGFEASVKYDVAKQWRLSSTYSYIDLQFNDKSAVILSLSGKNPRHMFNLHSTYLFSNELEMTNSLYTVSKLQSINIPSYYRFDTMLSYPVTPAININLVGQNLLDKRHKEFSSFLYQSRAEIGRSVYAGASFKF